MRSIGPNEPPKDRAIQYQYTPFFRVMRSEEWASRTASDQSRGQPIHAYPKPNAPETQLPRDKSGHKTEQISWHPTSRNPAQNSPRTSFSNLSSSISFFSQREFGKSVGKELSLTGVTWWWTLRRWFWVTHCSFDAAECDCRTNERGEIRAQWWIRGLIRIDVVA